MSDNIMPNKELAELENVIIENLNNLSQALSTAVESRFMAHEHGKSIWKAYLKLSGMDIPKELTQKGK